MVNYYELLEIARDADEKSIEQAIRKTRRLWNNRANNPDINIRTEAEMHVKEIAQAEKILLDQAKRKEYDLQLNQPPKPATKEQPANDDCSWEDEYFRAYDRDMNDYAAQVALEAIRRNERNGRAWFLYGEALRRVEDFTRSIDALKHASLLMDDVDVYRQLGFAYADFGNYAEAYKSFMQASRMDPEEFEYHSLAANCLRVIGRIQDAIAEAKIAYSMNSENEQARFEYFAALHEDAMRVMAYNRSSGKHLIINKKQLDYINNLLETMSVVIPKSDESCTKALEEIVKIAVDAESMKGGGFFKASKPGYEYNYEVSNADTRSTGLH